MKHKRWMAAAGCAAFAAVLVAQGPQRGGAPQVNAVPAAPGGTITGHVYCADTQRPARFADVEVLRQADPPQNQNANVTLVARGPMYQPVGRARTALDGTFAISGVPAGDYYVVGLMAGYISPVALARMTQSPISGVPFTHVESGRSADVVVSMTRGAAVAGRVVYDDGSPVPGVSVRVRSVASTSATGTGMLVMAGGNFGGDMGSGMTDDRGAYRLVGLPPGSYNVVATVQTESTASANGGRGGIRGPAAMLNVFAPAAMRKSEARTLEIHGGETVDGVDLQVALVGLKTLKGSVESKADGHMLNAGSVTVVDATDGSLSRNGAIDADGTFRVEYLPPGNYTLTVRGEDRSQQAGDGPGGRGGRTSTTRYQSASQAVQLGDHDVTVDPVQLNEVQPASSSGATTTGAMTGMAGSSSQ